MASFNRVLLMGNITRDIQLTYIPNSQTPVVEIGLAVNRTWTAQDGSKKEEVTFVDCSAFGKSAEVLAKYKKKGDPLFIEGRLKLDRWEKDGEKRYKMRVIIENFQFLNGSNHSEDAQPTDGNARSNPRQQQTQEAIREGVRRNNPKPPAGLEDDTPPIKDDDIPF